MKCNKFAIQSDGTIEGTFIFVDGIELGFLGSVNFSVNANKGPEVKILDHQSNEIPIEFIGG